MSMKKNIDRIQRWLNRLSGVCELEKWDSALFEADCLSAEVSKARDEIWCAAQDEYAARKAPVNRRTVYLAARSTGVALLIVFAASLPAAVEADRPWTATHQTRTVYVKEDRLSWVTPEEEELLLVLRAEAARAGANAAEAAAKTQHAHTTQVAAQVKKVPPRQVTASVNAASDTIDRKQPQGVTNEDLLALIQIGEKALRVSSPAITVISP